MHTENVVVRRALVTVVTLLLLLAGFPDASAADPAPPTGLRAEVYSRTAAELFWDRPDAVGLRYEVRRDGARLTVTDGVSHFDDTLAEGTAYRYEIIALDRDGRRSAPVAVTITTRGGDGGPAAPTGLRAEVYSRTAAELFWDRPDTVGLRYEVHRDGHRRTTTDGVSHFEDTLGAGTTYEYRVRTIDPLGRRSTSATVRLTTPGERDGGTDGGSALVAPEIERIAVYSGTAAELFWRRPSSGSPVVRVEISRDAVVLGTTDGTSFFDDTRSPGVDYDYALVAIDAGGRRSDGGTPDPDDGGDGLDTIRPDNAVALLGAAFDAYRGEPWGDIVFALPDFSRFPDLGLSGEQTLTCDNGGSATIRDINTGFGGGLGFVFDGCQDGETLIDGEIDNYQDRFFQVAKGTGITVTDPTATVRYSGHVRDLRDAKLWWTRETVDFERRSSTGSLYSLRATDLEFSYGFVPRGAPWEKVLLSGTLELTSDRTGGVTLSVSTPEALDRPAPDFDPGTGYAPLPDDWTFTQGSLRATAPDGSTVLLEAGNGDEASARLTVVDAAGTSTSFDEPWSTWRENLRFDQ